MISYKQANAARSRTIARLAKEVVLKTKAAQVKVGDKVQFDEDTVFTVQRIVDGVCHGLENGQHSAEYPLPTVQEYFDNQ